MAAARTFTYLCTIFIIFTNIVCARPSDNNDIPESATINFNMLSRRTFKFKCRPQERAYLARSFLKESQMNSDEKIVPNNIILRKCDEHSGCCQMDGYTCGQFKTQRVFFELQAENKFTGEKRPINISTIEDIECNCGIKSSPKRNDTNDVYVDSLMSTGLTNNTVEHNLLSFTSLLYLIYLLYMFR